jgi:hypothetical protein
MRILTLVTLMAAAYFVARGDQHAGCASVIAADGRVWNNVRMDWTIAGDLQLSDATGHRIITLPEKTTSYSYTSDSWYLGFLLGFSWWRQSATGSTQSPIELHAESCSSAKFPLSILAAFVDYRSRHRP